MYRKNEMLNPLLTIIGGFVLGTGMLIVGPIIIMVCWGALAPLFCLPTLSFWQSVALEYLLLTVGTALKGFSFKLNAKV